MKYNNVWTLLSLRCASFFAGLCLLALPAAGQGSFGAVIGRVTDPSSSSVPAATVTLTNTATNETKQVRADGSGDYRFLDLLPATYRVEVSAPGFKRFLRTSITVEVDTTARVDTPLAVGDVTETVQVTADSPQLQTDSGTLGFQIAPKEIEEAPLNGRNPLNLLGLVPGVVPQGSTDGAAGLNQGSHTSNVAWGNYQIGGNVAGQGAEFIDGAPINVYTNTVALVPTQDVVQEFKVQTNAVSAEFGRFSGGVVEIATKSGSNKFHGSAYEYFRNTVLNANDYFSNNAGIGRPKFNQNQYGVVANGPIVKDKTFFLFSWEGFGARIGIYTPAGVPSYNMEQGIFSTPISDPTGNCAVSTTANPGKYTIPKSCFDTTAVALFGLFPAPSAANPNNTTFANAPVAGSNTEQYTGRVDENLGSKNRLFGRYTYWHVQDSSLNLYTGSAINSGNAFSTNNTHQAVLGDTYSINSSTIVDLRFSYLREFFNNLPPTLGMNPSAYGAGPAALSVQQSYTVFPGVHLFGSHNYDNFFGSGISSATTSNNYVFSASLLKVIGKHTVKAGGDIRLIEQTGSGVNLFGAGGFTFLPVASNGFIGDEFAAFLLGEYNSAEITTTAKATNFEYAKAFYGTDTWQVSRNLTLNYGLRWELPGGLEEKKDRQTVTLPNATDPVTGQKGAVVLVNSALSPSRSSQTVRHDLFSPRLGFAYRVGASTAVRGGYALVYLPPDLVFGALASSAPINSATTTLTHTVYHGLQDPFGVLEGGKILQPAGRNPNFIQQFANQVVQSPVPSSHFPDLQQYNLSVSHQFHGDAVIEIGYAGATGRHLPAAGNANGQSVYGINQLSSQYYGLGAALLNPVTPGSAITVGQSLRPYPYFQDLQDSANYSSSSDFNALEIRAEKRFHSGGLVGAAFTWEKIIGNTDSTDFAAENKSGASNNGSGGVIQDYNNPRGERSILSYNLPRRLVVNYVLPLPFGHGQKYVSGAHGVAAALISGWALNGISTFQDGFAMGLSENSPNALTQYFGGGTLRPNYVPGCKRSLPGSALERVKSGAWFNAACFTDPDNFHFGTESRVDGALTAEGVDNFDIALLKSTKIRDRMELQFRTEVFNAFNRVQFDPPGVAVNGAAYDQVIAQANRPRLIQFSLRLNY